MKNFVGRLSEVEEKLASFDAERYLKKQGFISRFLGVFRRAK